MTFQELLKKAKKLSVDVKNDECACANGIHKSEKLDDYKRHVIRGLLIIPFFVAAIPFGAYLGILVSIIISGKDFFAYGGGILLA